MADNDDTSKRAALGGNQRDENNETEAADKVSEDYVRHRASFIMITKEMKPDDKISGAR